jgi:hypothetical protein
MTGDKGNGKPGDGLLAGLGEWWARVLGLDREATAAALEETIDGGELAAALTMAPAWQLASKDGKAWLVTTFRFPLFEAAALFSNFLFASVQMSTYGLVFELAVNSAGAAEVRLATPESSALTRGVVLFATILSHAFYLTEDKPARDAGREAP